MPTRVGAGVVWSGVGTLASPLVGFIHLSPIHISALSSLRCIILSGHLVW